MNLGWQIVERKPGRINFPITFVLSIVNEKLSKTSFVGHSIYHQHSQALIDIKGGTLSGVYPRDLSIHTPCFLFGSGDFASDSWIMEWEAQSIFRKRLRVSKSDWQTLCGRYFSENQPIQTLFWNFLYKKTKKEAGKNLDYGHFDFLTIFAHVDRTNWRNFEWQLVEG